VARRDLVEALKPLRRIVRKKDYDTPAVVSMEGSSLKVAFVGGSVSVSADGRRAGEVRDDRLYVGTAWGRCVWQAAFRSEIELPLDPDFLTFLRLPFQHSEDRLERAGLMPRVRKAQERLDRLVRKAADVLEPLDVTEDDVRRLVHSRLGGGPEG
jgi:hypothetical protein